ncbi:MAG: hypothetical protein IPP47_11395 [Bryobacterales bacterium]|nr:hypothetical protein [Bryobacterales bacterium]
MRKARRENERGFALLLVFAMAAAVAAMLYLEMPRVAFEHQRNKEGLLAERGEQYIRAIQLYYKKTNKYPQTMEDLESTNNIRFLRRRYKDPMTGEEEWRLIHVDSAGQFVDSLVHKRADEKKESGPSALSSNIIGIGASAEYVPQAGRRRARRRSGERATGSFPGWAAWRSRVDRVRRSRAVTAINRGADRQRHSRTDRRWRRREPTRYSRYSRDSCQGSRPDFRSRV